MLTFALGLSAHPQPQLGQGGELLQGIDTPAQWLRHREELLELFREHVYGRDPQARPRWNAQETTEPVFSGRGLRTLTRLELEFKGRRLLLDLLIYRPAGKGPWPTFVGLNFFGNKAIYPDPAIPLARGWVLRDPSIGIPAEQATVASRGMRSSNWPVERLLSRGYALCTLCYGDLDPDFDDGFANGVHGLMNQAEGWGSIAAWSWGLQRVADYLETREWAGSLAVIGHSRLGKAALWAGANDPRFQLVISNNSGCGGAALSKRLVGERVADINQRFPHWFTGRFRQYNGQEDLLPVDQHQLLALIAPRLLYVASAESDLWADPEGERLALEQAAPVFQRFGGRTGYHCRPGMHALTVYDWERFLDFADQY